MTEDTKPYTKEQMKFLMNINNDPCLNCGLTLRFCECKCFMSETDPKALNQFFEESKKEREELR